MPYHVVWLLVVMDLSNCIYTSDMTVTTTATLIASTVMGPALLMLPTLTINVTPVSEQMATKASPSDGRCCKHTETRNLSLRLCVSPIR